MLRQGRVDEGIEAYRTLLISAPHLADAWYNLGYLQRSARQFEAALASYGAALAHGIAGAEDVHVNRAVILAEHLGRDVEAEQELAKAISTSPTFLPAWLNLGLLHEDRGDALGARAAYQRAREIDPTHGRADARLAAIDIAEGKAAQAVRGLEERRAEAGLSQEGAAEIGFMLGNAHDSMGDYAAAFQAFVRANQIAQSVIPPQLRYSHAAHDRFIDDVIGAFPIADRLTSTTDGDPPVFICGMFRSGSTLCERLLARHSRVTAGGELETIPALVASRLQPYPARFAGLPNTGLDALRGEALIEWQARFPQADVLTDKLCANFLHIGLIKTLFPESKIVHTRRHVLDNILSVFFHYFDDSLSYGFSLDDLVHYYNGYRRIMDHWSSLYGKDIFDFDYDAVVRDPETVMRALLDFCGLEPETACLAGEAAQGIVRTASAWQIRAPLHVRSSGRWHNYAAQIPEVIAALPAYCGSSSP